MLLALQVHARDISGHPFAPGFPTGDPDLFLLILFLLIMAINSYRKPAQDTAPRCPSEEEQPLRDMDYRLRTSGQRGQNTNRSKDGGYAQQPCWYCLLSNRQMRPFHFVMMGTILACMLCLSVRSLLCSPSTPAIALENPLSNEIPEGCRHDASMGVVRSMGNDYPSLGVVECRRVTDRPSASAPTQETTYVTQQLASFEPCKTSTIHDIYMFTRTDLCTKNGTSATSISTDSCKSTHSSPSCSSTPGTACMASGYTIIYTTTITYTETTTVMPMTATLSDAGNVSTPCQPSVVLGYSQGTKSAHTTMGSCSEMPMALEGMKPSIDAKPIVLGPWRFELLVPHCSDTYSPLSSLSEEYPGFMECINHCVTANIGFDHPPCKGVALALGGLGDKPWCLTLSMTDMISFKYGGTRAVGSPREWVFGARLVRSP